MSPGHAVSTIHARSVDGPWRVGAGDRLERELRIGQEIQQGFLPTELPDPPDWQLRARLRPARMVAGDFYDAFPLANGRRTALLVADVCDKGVGAALFMALIRTLLRHTAQQNGAGTLHASDLELVARAATGPESGPGPASGAAPLLAAVRGTNDYLLRTHRQQGWFATVFFAALDPGSGELTYANCGHNPPFVLRRDGAVERLDPTGPAVGMGTDDAFALRRTRLAAGDTLLAFTDGVTEARDRTGAFFTDRRLAELVAGPVISATELVDRVDEAVREFAGTAEQYDDITLLAAHRSGAA